MDILENKEDNLEEVEKKQLDKIELDHIELLKSLALPCTSNNWRFTDRSRLEKIKKILLTSEDSTPGNYIVKSNLLSDIYIHKNINTKNVILLTAHCDTIPDIPFVTFDENTGLLHGTFDNLISDAVLTILMKEDDMPKNVVFAFTGDEETGKCKGCKSVVSYLNEQGYNITQAIALDVTWEGYNRANFSFENFGRKEDKHKDTVLYASYENITNECADSVNTPKGMYDEGYALRDAGIFESGSFCIPVQGNMHSNLGCYCKQSSFEGYILALSSMLYSLTNTRQRLIEEYKMMRNQLKPIPPVYNYNNYEYSTEVPWYYEVENKDNEYDFNDADCLPLTDWEVNDFLFDSLSLYDENQKEIFIADAINNPALHPYFKSQGLTSPEEIEDVLSDFFDENFIDYSMYR